ncbi:MAG: hypothetical protein ACYS1E_09990 [Planctomycetota bacterium]|jgi:hypothetical protein
MSPMLAVLLIGMASTPAEVEQEGVRIGVTISSHIYVWEVTNLGPEPITSFEIDNHNCYQHIVPDGWAFEADRRRYRAWATSAEAAIQPNQSKSFSARTSSGGNALGAVPVRVGLGPDGQRTVVFANVWGTVRKPRGLVALVAVLMSAVVAFHALMLSRRAQREEAPALTGDP